jgi:hypothetical protein
MHRIKNLKKKLFFLILIALLAFKLTFKVFLVNFSNIENSNLIIKKDSFENDFNFVSLVL